MDEIDLTMERISSVRGIGPSKLESLVKGLGGKEGLIAALERGNIGKMTAQGGVSVRMAVSMILASRSLGDPSLVEDAGARHTYDGIVSMLQGSMHTRMAKERCHLMVPTDPDPERSREIFGYRELIKGDSEALLSSLSRPGQKRSAIRPNIVIMTEDEDAYTSIRSRGLDRLCMVIDASDYEGRTDADLVYVYSSRNLDETNIDAVSMVSCEAPDHEIVPDMVIDRFVQRAGLVRTVGELEELYSREGACSEASELLDEIVRMDATIKGVEDVAEIIESIRSEVESSLKLRIGAVILGGEDALTMLSGEDPSTLREIYKEHSRMAQALVRERLGVSSDLFVMRYPLRTDEEALGNLLASMSNQRREDRFRRRVAIAGRLASLEGSIDEGIEWAHDLDFRHGLGVLVEQLDLRPFEQAKGWLGILNAGHLSLRGKDGVQPVDYHLGEVPCEWLDLFPTGRSTTSRIALLTGANSGGKTTLIETIAQVIIMAHMGLPVPAARAFVPAMSSIHMYRPRKHMDAGGLESFLKEFLPLCLDIDDTSIVLADELEAMTEQEAASRIIRTFLTRIEAKGAFSVVVTHMAKEVAGNHPFRIDGIEARGLSDDHRLIVDRTPRICHHARSMPELILKRLVGMTKGRERQLYEMVLGEFTPPR
ncbi:MAG: hypothetical protein QCI82_09940 [Candidatus Thermoplasmatota archaeon]|nr:hypothetical protein [Candidatus Thermoplasmatota archaeon]